MLRKIMGVEHHEAGTTDTGDLARNRNYAARLANGIVVSGEMTVSSLYSLETGQEIPHCPSTLAALEALSSEFPYCRDVFCVR